MAAHMQDHRSEPRLPIRVGVTGHRTRGLVEAGYNPGVLKGLVRRVLSNIKEVARQLSWQTGEPILQVISPLAEGADRIVAHEGLALGYELETALPFLCAEYEKDFQSEESRQDFRGLLHQAISVTELKGTRQQEAQAYEAVGRWVLSRSDVLIAIWNGKSAAGVGGTGQIVQESLLRKIPTIWLRPMNDAYLLQSTNPLCYESIEEGFDYSKLFLPPRIENDLAC
jgi:hypothetical protein